MRRGEEKGGALRKVMKAFRKVGFAPTNQKECTGYVFHLHKGRGKDQKSKVKEGAHLQSGLSVCKHLVKKDMAVAGNLTIGVRILLMIFRIQLDTLFWILVAHCQLDQERRSESSRNIHCIVELRQSFAFAISLSCLPTLRWRVVGYVVLIIFRQHFHVRPEWTCLKRAVCLSCSLFLQ